MSTKVVHVSRIGEVTFSRNRRSKSIKISVKHNNSVLVSFPFYVSVQKALEFVSQNEAWIILQKKKFESRKKKLDTGSVLYTKLHRLVFTEGDELKVSHSGDSKARQDDRTTGRGNNTAEQQQSTITITVKDFHAAETERYVDHVLTEIYRFEAKKLLPERLHQIAVQHGFTYNKVTIRNNRRNWGSCSSKNNISLNLQMMKMPDELIDYVLIHELVHTRIKNHGPAFWQEMNRLTNNRAKELAGMVKKYSAYTL